ncbi:MAG: RNA methyltransferase [Pseudomonadota bacterium]
MLENIIVVMVKTRFPENIGMVARACANMGAGSMVLVEPELWDMEKAKPLATSKGLSILENLSVVGTIAEAVKDCAVVVGTTARTGGWRRDIATPSVISPEIARILAHGDKVALLLGPEDRGLNNEEIEHCTRLVTIPTAAEASSLNVAQAALLMLYEWHKAWQECRQSTAYVSKHAEIVPEKSTEKEPEKHSDNDASRRISQKENTILFETLRATLLEIDYLKQDNTDYFLMPLRRFLGKQDIVRHEFDMLMGICRQVRRLAKLHNKSL